MRPDEARPVYEGRFVQVTLERWGDAEREIVEHPGAVAIIAVDRHDAVTLVRQRREAVRKSLLELPAGTLGADEEPLACARRELAEETGLHGGRWRELSRVHSSPGFVRELIVLFLAEDVEAGTPHPDGEDIELVRWPLSDVSRRLGEIEDAKTLAGLLLLLREHRK